MRAIDVELPFERGMRESERAALHKWDAFERRCVAYAIDAVARRKKTFTTDDVWAALGPKFPFSKGMASQLIAAVNRGTIQNTGRVAFARRGGEHDHAQRLTIWRSKLLDEKGRVLA